LRGSTLDFTEISLAYSDNYSMNVSKISSDCIPVKEKSATETQRKTTTTTLFNRELLPAGRDENSKRTS
jgi:hypothetical protein